MFKLKIKYRECPEMNQEIICATFWTTESMNYLHYKTSLDSNIEHVVIIKGVACDVFIGPNEMPERKREKTKFKPDLSSSVTAYFNGILDNLNKEFKKGGDK